MKIGKIPQLDGLRAIAVLLVIASHAGLGKIVPGGFGVTIFFFLSGYLITTLLRVEYAETRDVNLRAFYLRRFLRIAPPLYITLVLVNIVQVQGLLGPSPGSSTFIWDYLMLSNYAHLWGQEGGLKIPLWSLAVEEHFYLLFPAAFILLKKYTREKNIPIVLIAVCFLTLIVRFLTIFLQMDLERNYYWSHTRMDSILFGSILAVWQNPLLDAQRWKPRAIHFMAAIGLLLMTFVIRDNEFRQTVRYTIQGIALFVIFSFVIDKRVGIIDKILTSRLFRWIGDTSYTLYLGHMAILAGLYHVFGPGLLTTVIGLALSCVYAQLMRMAVEKPILKWRRRHPAQVQSALAPI